jgi:hypothetical protein
MAHCHRSPQDREHPLWFNCAALLTVAKPNKINPISPSETFDNRYKAHGHHDLWQAMGVYVDRQIITMTLISILGKTTVTEMGFSFIDKDLNLGLENLVDNTLPNWKPTKIPDGTLWTPAGMIPHLCSRSFPTCALSATAALLQWAT